MLTVIISDVHLGSPYSLQLRFCKFLESLPDNTTLVLNGDTIDSYPRGAVLPPQDYSAELEALNAAAARLNLIWISGNHQKNREYAPPGAFVTDSFEIPGRVYVLHGDNLHRRHLGWNLFTNLFYLLHELRIRLGCRPAHVSVYAKRWRLFYRLLCRQVAVNAVALAREKGFTTVVCGHVHGMADFEINGCRYLNTGSWLEAPPYLVVVDEQQTRLSECPDNITAEFWR